MFGTSNGLSQKAAWREHSEDNELIFQFPQSLNVGLSIVIQGQLAQNKERLRIGLTKGSANSVENFLCYIDFDFPGEEIIIVKNENGSQVEAEKIAELSQLTTDADFTLHMKFKETESDLVLGTMLGSYAFGNVHLNTDLHEGNMFLTVRMYPENTFKLQQLKFLWA